MVFAAVFTYGAAMFMYGGWSIDGTAAVHVPSIDGALLVLCGERYLLGALDRLRLHARR
jgi:hypothetical protein